MTIMVIFNPAEVMMLLVGPQLQIRRAIKGQKRVDVREKEPKIEDTKGHKTKQQERKGKSRKRERRKEKK